MECETPILSGCEDATLNPIQFLDVQQHGFVSNLNVRPPVKNDFEDIVADAFSIKVSVDMLTKLALGIELQGGLDSFSLKDN